VETALKKYAVYNHPKYGKIYAFEVDGFGNHMLMDDANVPSLLAMPYLGIRIHQHLDARLDLRIILAGESFHHDTHGPYHIVSDVWSANALACLTFEEVRIRGGNSPEEICRLQSSQIRKDLCFRGGRFW